MRKRIVQLLASATAITAICIASLGGARASLLSIPAMIPDLCLMGHCVQFTQTAALASVQHVIADVNMLNNMEQQLSQIKINARTMLGFWPQLKGDMATLQSAYKTTFPGVSAAAAADAYNKQMSSDQAYIDSLSPIADGAQGSTQTAQVTNRYLEQVDGDMRKVGALQAAEIKQHQDEETGDAVGVFGVLNSSQPTDPSNGTRF